jgi:excisionase family DNA binding protein
MEKKFITIEDVARILMISLYTARKYARDGLIVGKKIGRRWLFSIDSLTQLIK